MSTHPNWRDRMKEIKRLIKEEADFKQAYESIANLSISDIPDGSNALDPQLADALHLRSMAAEICDYYGNFAKARAFVEHTGGICYVHLRSLAVPGNPPVPPDRDLLLQQVWVVLQAGLCEYRLEKLDSALAMFDVCRAISAGPLLVSGDRQRYGTQARALYSIGLVEREKYRLNASIECLTASAELAYLSWKQDLTEGKPDSKLVPVAIARSIGMGLAVVHNSLGRPDLAVPLLLTAKAMLPKQELIISTHIDLTAATLVPRPHATGRPESGARATIAKLEECFAVFKQAEHRLYQTRTAYFLAREHIKLAAPHSPGDAPHTREIAKAREYLRELEFSVSGNWGFVLRGVELGSRIELLLNNPERAEEQAGWGLAQSSPSRNPSAHLDLLLTRARIRIAQRKWHAAIDDLRAGQQFASAEGNQYLTALFILRMSKAFFLAGDFREATRLHSRFLEMKDFLGTKTVDVDAAEAEVRSLIENHPEDNDYVLRINEELDPLEEQKKFRTALIRWARDRSDTEQEAADLLKVTRQTLHNWQKQIGKS